MWTPKIIKTDDDHEAALERLDWLMEQGSDAPQNVLEELRLVTKLIEDYEIEQDEFSLPDPIAAIRFVMDQRGLKNKDLIALIGPSGRVSEILSGKRKLTLAMIRKLHETLGIPADILMQEQVTLLSTSYGPSRIVEVA